SGQNIVVRETDQELYPDKTSLSGKKIGVQAGSLQEELAAQIDDADLMKLTNLNDLLLALKTNKVEAVLMEKPNAEAHAGADPQLLTYDGGFQLKEGEEGAAIALRKGSDELVDAINISLGEIEEQDLVTQYLAKAGEYLEDAQGESDQSFLSQYGAYFLKGAGSTIFISVLSVFFGLILGVLLSFLRLSSNIFLRAIGTGYVEFVRGTPMLIQVMFIYFGVGTLINIPALTAGIVAVSLNSGAYICEIIRSGLNSVPVGQTE